MKKRTKSFSFSFVEYYIFNNFVGDKHNNNLATFQILGGGNIHTVLRDFLQNVFRILFNNDPQQFLLN